MTKTSTFTETPQEYEYELIDIAWDLEYDLTEGEPPLMVRDGTDQEESPRPSIVYDANGIPMGKSPEDNRLRKQIIFDFYESWKAAHPEKCVHNDSLDADILIRTESVTEAAGHAARNYLSTLAVLRLDELLKGAKYVDTDKAKPDNKNQAKLIRMILMSYRFQDIGLVKLTIGVRNRTLDKVQYGITAVDSDQEIKAKVTDSQTKKAPHKK